MNLHIRFRAMALVVAMLALFVSATSAFAWNNSICNPTTGEVLQGGGAPPLTTEALYFAYLDNHKAEGAHEMSPGEVCKRPTPHPTPDLTPIPTPSETPVATPVATPPPVVTHIATPVTPATTTGVAPPVVAPAPPAPAPPTSDNRPFVCHYEPSVGFSTPRRSNDVLKDEAKGDTPLVKGLCEKLAEVVAAPIIPAAPMPAPAPVVSTPAVPDVQVTAPPITVTDTPQDVPDEWVPDEELVPSPNEPFAPPPAGDGTGADEIVP